MLGCSGVRLRFESQRSLSQCGRSLDQECSSTTRGRRRGTPHLRRRCSLEWCDISHPVNGPEMEMQLDRARIRGCGRLHVESQHC